MGLQHASTVGARQHFETAVCFVSVVESNQEMQPTKARNFDACIAVQNRSVLMKRKTSTHARRLHGELVEIRVMAYGPDDHDDNRFWAASRTTLWVGRHG